MKARITIKPPIGTIPVNILLPDGWRVRLPREIVQYGDLTMEINPLRWVIMTRGGYLVNMGTYICKVGT